MHSLSAPSYCHGRAKGNGRLARAYIAARPSSGKRLETKECKRCAILSSELGQVRLCVMREFKAVLCKFICLGVSTAELHQGEGTNNALQGKEERPCASG